MRPDQEEFLELRRLLALKRHEVPPPGYFHGFSGQVIARIRVGESGDNQGATAILRGDWFQRFWSALEARPTFAGACAVGLCAVLVSGFISSEQGALENQPALVAMESTPSPFGAAAPQRAAAVTPSGSFSGTMGLAAPRPSLFDQPSNLRVQPVSFSVPSPR